eukprot:TRINITY_DN640_c0_g1_i1.p1 TRINITY_DN640_c0_g1~~TRINITY_DN640_c0_g1_i1.p1  ORF type:complete len:1677 (-),score=500.21 TRINITY_DN640_c0_g1_i1:75-5105(-)
MSLALRLIFGCIAICFAQIATAQLSLQEIQLRISDQKEISASSLNSTGLWTYIKRSLDVQQDGISLNSFDAEIITQNGQSELVVTASVSIWQQTVNSTFVFYYSTNALDVFAQFQIGLEKFPSYLVPNSSASWFDGLSLSGAAKISVSSASFKDLSGNSYSEGLTITASAEVEDSLGISQQLQKLVNSASVTGSLVAVFPFDESDGPAHFTLVIENSIYFDSTSYESSDLTLEVTDGPSASAQLTADVQLTNIGGDKQTITFSVEADVSAAQGFSFTGQMPGSWKNAFGLSWLTLSEVTLSFDFTPNWSNTAFNFAGTAAFNLGADQPSGSFTFSTSLATTAVTFSVSVPISSLADLFGAVNNGTSPLYVDQVEVTGNVVLTVSTVNYSGGKAGLTVVGTAQIGGNGPLASAISAISAAETLNFNLNLFIPVFGPNPGDVTFNLAETSPIDVSDDISLSGFAIAFTTSPMEVTGSTTLQIAFPGSATPVNFAVSTEITEGSLTFTGTQSGSWAPAFGLAWLSLNNVDVTFEVDNGWNDTSFSFSGLATFSFATGVTSAVTFEITNLETDVSISTLISLSSLEGLFQSTLGQAPEYQDQVALNNQVQIIISTYNHDTVKAGLTVLGNAQISGSGALVNAATSVGSQSASFNLNLFVPVFGPNPAEGVTFSLAETGTVTLSDNITLSAVTFSFTVSPLQTSLSGTLGLLLGGSSPVTFAVAATVTDTQITFNGQQNGNWANFLGLSWVTLQKVTVGFTYATSGSQSWALTQFSFNGLAVFSFDGVSSSVTFSTNTQNVNILVTISAPISTLENLLTAVVGSTPLYSEQIAITGQMSLTISNYATKTYQEGLTLVANAKVAGTGPLVSAVTAISPATSLNFGVNLYVPVFGPNVADVDLSLTASGNVDLSSALQLQNLQFTFQYTPSEVTASSNLIVQPAQQGTPLTFTVSGEVTPQEFELTGALPGTWSDAFGLNWLSISAVSVSVDFDQSTTSLASVVIDGTAGVTFVGGSSAVSVNFGPDFENWQLQFSVSITNSNAFFAAVSNAPASSAADFTFNGDLILSSYATGKIASGLTFTGSAVVAAGTDTYALLKQLNAPTFTFDALFTIPVFTAGTPTASFSVVQAGSIALTDNILLNGFDLTVSVLPSQSVSVSTNAEIAIKYQSGFLNFDLSAESDPQNPLVLTGSLNGAWDHPFGLNWLEFTGLQAEVTFDTTSVVSLDFTGDVLLTFSKTNTTIEASIQTADNFMDSTLTVEGLTIFGLGDVAAKTTGSQVDQVSSLSSTTNQISLVLSTYSHGWIDEGLTIVDIVTVNGDLLNKLSVFDSYKDISAGQFGVSLNIPVFAGQSQDIVFTLNTTAVQITANSIMTGVIIEVNTYPGSVEIETGLLVNFTYNPTLQFDASGTFDSDGTIQIAGQMIGTWDNMFGLTGFDLSNVEVAIGFNPTLCATTACVDAFGIGYTLGIGSENISFEGYAQVPKFWDVFLDGSIAGPDGMALSFRNIAEEFNSFSPIHIDVIDIPPTWGIEDTYIRIAPEAGTFNNIHYDAGFWIEGGFVIFGIGCSIDIAVTTDDFEFSVDIYLSEFEQRLNKELHFLLMTSPNATNLSKDQIDDYLSGRSLISVKNVTLADFSAGTYAQHQYPEFDLHYEFFGHQHFSVGLPLLDLYNDFHHFFVKYLQHLF